jgi:UDP-N-acetyl-alpha-D-muramoyl-L-alanyl-L-glutamate epimerase
MIRAKTLSFDTFKIEGSSFTFSYTLDEQVVELKLSHSLPITVSEGAQQTVLFNLGMCYLHDLAELTLPESIHVNFGLTDLQLEFWQRTYQEVSKEKLYVDKLDIEALDAVWTRKSNQQEFLSFALPENRTSTALCLTGGKESLVLLKKLQHQTDLLLLFLNPETNVHRQKVFDRVSPSFATTKTISNRPDVFAHIKEKYQTELGSGVDMVHLVFNALLYGNICKQVVIGNEYSSNFPNFVYQGYVINHQYVKTLYFAQRINNYLHTFVAPDFTYYSPFFGMYEYKIAQYLFEDQEYLEVWTSCNQTTPTVNFCCNCPKCAFTYLTALMYTSPEFLQTFFSRDLLDDVELYRPLMDFTGEKPLDCVGEKKEVWVALWKLSQKPEFMNKPVVEYFKKNIQPFIETELEKFEKEITSVQKVPQQLPDELVIS